MKRGLAVGLAACVPLGVAILIAAVTPAQHGSSVSAAAAISSPQDTVVAPIGSPSAVIDTRPPGPAAPIAGAQDAVNRALHNKATIGSVTHSQATLTTIAAVISTGRMTAPPPGVAASQPVWAVGIKGVIKPVDARGYTYDWEIVLYDAASGSVLDVSTGDGPLPAY